MTVTISSYSRDALSGESPEIQALWRISQTINSTLDLNEVLCSLILEMPALLAAQSASVILHNEATKEAELTTTYGAEGTVQSFRYPLAGSLTEWVSMYKRPLRIARLTPEEWPTVWCLGVQLGAVPERISVLLVPLWKQGVVIGSLEVVWEPHHVITDHEEQFLEVLAGQAASAITNAWLYQDKERVLQKTQQAEEALQEESAITAALAHVGQELIAALGSLTIGERLCQLVMEALACDFSTTFFLQLERKGIHAVADCGHTAEQFAILQTLKPSQEELHTMLARLEEKEVVAITSDASTFPIATALFGQSDVTMMVYLALRRGQDLIGAQTAGYRRRTQWSPAQQRIAQGLAHLASLALESSRLLEEAQGASRLKSEFLATMSHELRTPLNIILGYTDFLLEGDLGPLTAEQTDALRRMDKSAQDLLELVTAALDVSRLEAGRLPREISQVNIAELMTELQREAQTLCSRAGLSLTWRGAPNLPALSTDRIKLKVVLRNLLGNAVKFTTEGGITVHVQPRDEGVEFRVTDTGIGISPETKALMFEMFRQGDSSMTRSYGGAGLGLYIVKRFLEVLHGVVTVESEVGKGSTFRVWLPLAVEG